MYIVESNRTHEQTKQSRLINIREQTGGCEWGDGTGSAKIREGDKEVKNPSCKVGKSWG